MSPVTTALPSELTAAPLSLLEESATGNAARDLDRHVDLLREVGRGERGPLMRLYVPQPTLAFGRRDARLPGFQPAWDSVAAAGFTPVVRSAGGRATAYHEGTLIVDQIQPDPEPMLSHQSRFRIFGDLFVDALRAAGVDARVGEIPGEYCPGEFSVHGVGADGSRVKLVGTAQRVVAGAWLFSSVVVVSGAESLRSVTEQVYRDLGMELDPTTVGSVEDVAPRRPASTPLPILDRTTANGARSDQNSQGGCGGVPDADGPRPLPPTVADVAGAVVAAWEAAGYRFE